MESKIPNKIFLKWKTELFRHTDLMPITEREPVLSITKPK